MGFKGKSHAHGGPWGIWKQLSGLLLLLILAGCAGGGALTHTVLLVLDVEPGGRVVAETQAGTQVCHGGEECRWVYQRGTRITLEAIPGEGRRFGGWQGACSGYGVCTLTLDQDLWVKATFPPLTGDFQLEEIASPLVVPAGGRVEMTLGLRLIGGLSTPPEAYQVLLQGKLVGDGVDQVGYCYLPERSQPDRLVVALEGPDPSEVWTYIAAPARAVVRLGSLERALDFTLAVAPCVAGCGR
ncbi:MAG: InlB B-repeat-containing protein [Thermus sp.]|uniref:InlB B-repeat-containing protein n=1 Tax=Thermus sp. TaxID=275 RepID=UPI00391CA24E